MKFKRLLAAILTALMVTSCFSFVASAKEEESAELMATGLLKEFGSKSGGLGGLGGAMDESSTSKKYYDAVNDILFTRYKINDDAAGGTFHMNWSGTTIKMDADDDTVNGAYIVRMNNPGIQPMARIMQPVYKDGQSRYTQYNYGTAIKGDGTWETAKVAIVEPTLTSFKQVHTYLAGYPALPAGFWFDIAHGAYANDEATAVATVEVPSKYACDYNITFNLNFGDSENLDVYPAEIPNRVADGYIFEGWSTKADAKEGEAEYTDLTCVAVPTADTTYYAVWGDDIEEENAVYISANGDDANSGRHSRLPIKTLAKADAIFEAEGNEALDTLYVVGSTAPHTIIKDGKVTAAEISFGTTAKTIKIRGYNGISDVFHATDSHFAFDGALDFDNITIKQGSGDGKFMAQGHDTIIGKNVVVTGAKYFSHFYYGKKGNHGYGTSATNLADATATFNGGTWSEMHGGIWTNNGTYYGKSTLIINGATVTNIKNGHGSGTNQYFKGDFRVDVESGSVGAINLDSSTDNAINSYAGVRYFTLNGGAVTGDITVTSKNVSKDGKLTKSADSGYTIVEINAPNVLKGSIVQGKADDDAERIVIYNNNSYVAGQVKDVKAKVIIPVGGTLTANASSTINSSGTVTTVFDTYSYTADASVNTIKINDVRYPVSHFEAGKIPNGLFVSGENRVEFLTLEEELVHSDRMQAYIDAGYDVVYISATGAGAKNGETKGDAVAVDYITTALSAYVKKDSKVVLALVGTIPTSPNASTTPTAESGADVIITSENGNYGCIKFSGTSAPLRLAPGSNYKFDNIYFTIINDTQNHIYASGSNVELTSTVTTNSVAKSGLVVAHGRNSDESFGGGTITIDNKMYLVRVGAAEGTNITGDVKYIINSNASNIYVSAGGHAGNVAGKDAGTVKGDVYVDINGASIENLNPGYKATVNGNIIMNINNDAVIKLFKPEFEASNGKVTGDYVVYLNDGTINKAEKFNGGTFGGKKVFIANSEKATYPETVATFMPYVVSYTGKGKVTFDTATDKLILLPEASAKYVRVTNGETVKEYNVNGDEVTLAGEFSVDLASGTTTVEFLTEGTEIHTIKFVDGDTTDTQTVTAGTVPTAPAWTKEHYTLTWDKEIVAATASTTYTAVWTANEYDVVFNAGEGTFADGKTVTVKTAFNSAITAPTAPTRTGYAFKGWDKEVGTLTTEGATFNAVWEVNKYDVVFNAGEGTFGESNTATVETTFGEAITAPANPTREGYVFFGWDKTVGNLTTEGATFNAVWEMNHVAAYRAAGYKIVYVKTGTSGNGTSPIAPYKDFATAISKTKSLTADDTVVYAILGNVIVTGWIDNGPAAMIITKGNEEGQIYTDNIYFNNNNYAKTGPWAKKITFDNIKIGLNPSNTNGANAEVGIYAYSSDIEFTSTVIVNHQYKYQDRTKGILIHPFGAGNSNIQTNSENVNVIINSGFIEDVRAVGYQGGSSTGDITYVLGGTAEVTAVHAAGHATMNGVTNKTVTGDIFVTVKENATVNALYPSNAGKLDGDFYVNVEGGTVTNLYLNASGGGTTTGDYIITYTGGTISNIKGSGTNFGTKRILIADLDKVTLPEVCNNLTGILTYTANGSIALNEDLTKIIIKPEANAKYVKVTMGDDVKTYNVNGDEVTLLGEFEVEYTGGNVSVEFLTDGTETKKVTFKNGDETVSEALIAVGTVPTAPVLTKTGYTLTWDKEIVAVTEAVTYTAVWTANQYDVTFNAGDGTFGESNTYTVKVAFNSAITAPTAPTRTGYAFKGWDAAVGTLTTEGATFNAVWEANTYTITYYVDGTEYKIVTYAYGAEVTMESAPEKDGYTFSGWDKTITTMPAENVTVNGTFTKDEEPEITGAIYKTYGVYDVEAGTYTVELKLYGVKANAGSFGFVLPGLVSVTPAEGITLFAETGSAVSPIFAKDDNHYANTWAIEGGTGNIDATVEEVLIATFVLKATSSFPEKFDEYVVENADSKYHNGTNYLVTPHIDNSLETGNKAPVIYAEHFDRVEEPDFDGVKFTTKGTYDPTKNQYSIEIYVEGKKINLGAFGLAFNSEYMTFNPEAEESVKLADGIANYLDIVLNNTAAGYAFVFDGSNNEEGYIDATSGKVLVATITTTMTADQRTAFENAGKTMEIFVPAESVDGIEKYFDFTKNAYIASLYTNDLDIPKVATVYASHTDEALELTAVDLTVNVVFNDRAEDAAGYNNAVIKLNDEKFDLEGTQHVFEGLEVGATYTVTIEKNGYLKASYEITLEESTELEFKLYAGDIKGNAADICGDGKVDLSDFVRVIRAFDSSSNEQFKKDVDLDESGLVNVSDLSIIKKNYNMTSDYNVITKK